MPDTAALIDAFVDRLTPKRAGLPYASLEVDKDVLRAELVQLLEDYERDRAGEQVGQAKAEPPPPPAEPAPVAADETTTDAEAPKAATPASTRGRKS